MGMKYLGKSVPCSNALKSHEGKKRQEKRQFCQYAESAAGACANPAPPLESDP